MAFEVANNAFGNIGRMFARQNVSAVYGRQKSSAQAEDEEAVAGVDRVTLSSSAPQPLSADLLEDAMSTAKTVGEGGKLSKDSEQRLREDRVFRAVSTLAMIYKDETQLGNRGWPGGLPQPTAEELEAAKKRLSQRLRNLDTAADPEQAQNDRMALFDRIRNRNVGDVSAANSAVLATLAASA